MTTSIVVRKTDRLGGVNEVTRDSGNFVLGMPSLPFGVNLRHQHFERCHRLRALHLRSALFGRCATVFSQFVVRHPGKSVTQNDKFGSNESGHG